jgi:two-component system, NtrC family, nitrogen regulation sensor histidine kinase GlnL
MTAARVERSASGGSMADAVLNALPHPVVTIGADGFVVDANAAAEDFFRSARR